MALRGCLAVRESETESETRERTRRENERKSEIFLQFSLRFLPAIYALRDCRCEGGGRAPVETAIETETTEPTAL